MSVPGVTGGGWPIRTPMDKAMQTEYGKPGTLAAKPANIPGEYIGVLGQRLGRSQMDQFMQKDFNAGKGPDEMASLFKHPVHWNNKGDSKESYLRTAYDDAMQMEFNPWWWNDIETFGVRSGYASTQNNPNNPMMPMKYMPLQ